MSEILKVPKGERVHIGFFGKVNSGKSSLVNAFLGEEVSIVSEIMGTTTDLVQRATEVFGIGPCLIIDTAGLEDESELSLARLQKTELASQQSDVAVILFNGEDISCELALARKFKEQQTPILPIISKADLISNENELRAKIKKEAGLDAIALSKFDNELRQKITEEIIKLIPDNEERLLCSGLAEAGDAVLLVMPQDREAPKGRLILPQAQTIRELIDKGCITICTDFENMDNALARLNAPPKLIITDSQIFKKVYLKKPKESLLTSFSILFANYKGDIRYFADSAKAIDSLKAGSRVLISELCSHAPLEEDIGRIKIPHLLREKAVESIEIDFCRGTDFPIDAKSYDLIIECGGCMFGRKYIMSRVKKARELKIPMTNYGIAIAYMNGILDSVALPKNEF